ncbi:exodeoxyribonuclease VII small subunit, partial [bacterium]|nr:exodeoxyribonuclease VII small subunit [bacterium]
CSSFSDNNPFSERLILVSSGKDDKKFEKRLTDLEEIVAKLESGETPLEDSLVLFEEGTNILKKLTHILEEAERKVEVLTRDMSGSLATEPFEEEEDK